MDFQLPGSESDTVEFKENFDRETVETASAFANTRGGIILVGVSDKGVFKGVGVGKETLRDWTNRISQGTEPSVIPDIEVKGIKGENLVIIKIVEFPIKPVSVRGRCFRRVGNSNRVMTPHGIAQMHLQSTGASWDAFPARDASVDGIDRGKVEKYIRRANFTGRRRISDEEEPLQVLGKLELIKDGRPTWAAILLFGENPRRFLPQARVHCGRFKTETTIVDDGMIEGAITEQIDETMNFIRKNINVEFVITGKPQREEVWDYPLDALREAVLNAICHRDYTSSSDTQIRIYDDRLIVWNPGGLPFGLTIEDLYKPHGSLPRNKLIANVLYDIGWIEQWGSGIARMRKACSDAGIPEPQFEEYQGFRVTFRKDMYTGEYLQNIGLNERQVKAVMHAKKDGNIKLSSFKTLVPDVSEKTLYRDLLDLVDKRLMKELGEKKGRRYVLV